MLSTGTDWYDRLSRPENLKMLFDTYVLTKHEPVQVIVNGNCLLKRHMVTRTICVDQPLSSLQTKSAMTESVAREKCVPSARWLWQEMKPRETVLIEPGGHRGIPNCMLLEQQVSKPVKSPYVSGTTAGDHCIPPPLAYKLPKHHPTLLNPGQ